VLDAPYDRQVERCRLRPIARYAVSSRSALLFMAAQIVLGVFVTLAPLPHGSRAPAALLTGTQIVYPLFKRFTNYPQLWLGSSFALGLGVGAGAGGLDLGAILIRLSRNIDPSQEITALEAQDIHVLGALAYLFAAILLNT
jgi:4-hydroxybenzoate polyprenyltransferase